MIPEHLSINRDGQWGDATVQRPVAGGWEIVIGQPDVHYPPPPFTPDGGTVANVGTDCCQVGVGVQHGPTGRASWTRHLVTTNAATLTLVWWSNTDNMIATTADTEIRARVRSASNDWSDLTFSGNPVGLIPKAVGGHALTSDPVPGRWYKGEQIEVLTWARIPSGEGTGAASNTFTRQVGEGVATNIGWDAAKATVPYGHGQALRPSLILADTLGGPSWIGVGDSISAGPAPHIDEALSIIGHPYTLAAQGGYSYLYQGDGGAGYKARGGDWLTAGHANRVLSAHGVNDGGNAISNATAVWHLWKRDGAASICQVTLYPTNMQPAEWTPGQVNPSRIGSSEFNTWLRDGAPIIGTAPAPTGTTDPNAARARVYRLDGTVKPGQGAHVLGGGGIIEMGGHFEPQLGAFYWKAELASLVGGDTLHPGAGIHRIAGPIVAEGIQALGA